jgi:hypothetical protein
MFPLMSILAALPWRFIGVGAVISMLFVGGCQYGEKRGEQRVMARWDAEKAATAVAVTHQAEQVAAVSAHQSTINQEISNDLQKAKVVLAAERGHVFERAAPAIARSMRDDSAAGSAGAVPDVSGGTTGANAATAHALPDSAGPATSFQCEQLAGDAAQTTLMLLELQHWLARQSTAASETEP